MKKVICHLTMGCIAVAGFVHTASAQNDEFLMEHLKAAAVIEQKVMVPMRDGIRLATDIYRPPTPTVRCRRSS